MRKLRFILLLLIVSVPMWGQVDRKEVRRGNREFRKGEYEAAFEDYLRAVEKDTSSIAANYNMASALYRMEKYDQAQQALDRIKETAPESASAADYLYNLGEGFRRGFDSQTGRSGCKGEFHLCQKDAAESAAERSESEQ